MITIYPCSGLKGPAICCPQGRIISPPIVPLIKGLSMLRRLTFDISSGSEISVALQFQWHSRLIQVVVAGNIQYDGIALLIVVWLWADNWQGSGQGMRFCDKKERYFFCVQTFLVGQDSSKKLFHEKFPSSNIVYVLISEYSEQSRVTQKMCDMTDEEWLWIALWSHAIIELRIDCTLSVCY